MAFLFTSISTLSISASVYAFASSKALLALDVASPTAVLIASALAVAIKPSALVIFVIAVSLAVTLPARAVKSDARA